jgi:hypothetical protein
VYPSTFNLYRTPGLAARPGLYRIIAGWGQNYETGGHEVGVPVADLRIAPGAGVRLCAPPDMTGNRVLWDLDA